MSDSAVNAAARAAASLHRVLIVDDEQMVLNGLRSTLEREGYVVVTANNPFQALTELKQAIFSVIISDFQMPGLTGLEFLAQAKQVQPNASRILITAVLSLDTVIDAINKGEIYRFIVKPWLREEFLATVKNAAQRYELIDSNTVLQSKAVVLNRELQEANRALEVQLARVAEQNETLGQLNQALNQNLHHSVQLAVQVLQAFSPPLALCARRVQQLCLALAESLHLDATQRQVLEFSACLHDIGLVALQRDLVRRWELGPAALTPEEQKLIQTHPALGQNLVKFEHDLEEVGVVIRAHEEHFDGRGYPDGLSGEAIPWLARLLAVAAAYAEFPGPPGEALAAIQRASGSQFDPMAVRALLQALPTSNLPQRERVVPIRDLRPGMVLAKGIYTPTGTVLIPEGQSLSEACIDKIRAHQSGSDDSLIVYC